MASRTINTCDKCKKEGIDLRLQHIVVGTESVYRGSYTHGPQLSVYERLKEWSEEWCSDCCDKVGINLERFPVNRKETDVKPASLEDMVREIVREEIPR